MQTSKYAGTVLLTRSALPSQPDTDDWCPGASRPFHIYTSGLAKPAEKRLQCLSTSSCCGAIPGWPNVLSGPSPKATISLLLNTSSSIDRWGRGVLFKGGYYSGGGGRPRADGTLRGSFCARLGRAPEQHLASSAGLSLRREGGGEAFFTPTETNVRDALCFMVKIWTRHKTTETVLNNGWRLAVVGGGWWQLAVCGWRLVVGGWWPLGAVLKGCP